MECGLADADIGFSVMTACCKARAVVERAATHFVRSFGTSSMHRHSGLLVAGGNRVGLPRAGPLGELP